MRGRIMGGTFAVKKGGNGDQQSKAMIGKKEFPTKSGGVGNLKEGENCHCRNQKGGKKEAIIPRKKCFHRDVLRSSQAGRKSGE